MNFFEREFQRLFGDGRIIKNLSFAGPTCWGRLNDDLRVRVKLTCSETAYLYDALNITVLDRMDKPIGTVLLKFQDVWGKQIVPGMPDCPDGIAPHIWTSRGKTEWHGWRPTPADREILRQQIRQSMKPFRDLAAERSPAQDQGIPVAFEQEAPLVRPAPQAVRLEREPGAMSGKWKDALQKRLEENYAAYTAQLTWKSFADLIEIADEIAAAKFVCENLASICTDSDAALLLRFDDPLELMRDRWLEETRVDHSEEIRHTIWTVRDRIEDFLSDYNPARPQPASRKPRRKENER